MPFSNSKTNAIQLLIDHSQLKIKLFTFIFIHLNFFPRSIVHFKCKNSNYVNSKVWEIMKSSNG